MSDRFPARRSRGGDLAVLVAAVLLVAGLAVLVVAASREPGPTMVALFCAAAVLVAAGSLLGLWALAYRRLSYALTQTALRVEWLGRTLVVPYAAVQGIYGGQRLAGNAAPGGPRWPGVNVGSRWVRGMGKLRFFATSSDQSQLTLITVEHGGLVLSARDVVAFQTSLIDHVEASPEEEATWHEAPPTTAPWTALLDLWLPVCAAVGVLVLLLLLAVIAIRYANLPDQLPIHFDVSGESSYTTAKSDLLRLPLLGLIVLALNWVLGVMVHARERVLARLLWLVAIVVDLVLLIGLVRIVT
ncbi:MAG: DUF1648 domain-containing protein [Chloroflexi bacterium]|nr:DUF1648 domain-containing protein [Chloroflexota bacterium]